MAISCPNCGNAQEAFLEKKAEGKIGCGFCNCDFYQETVVGFYNKFLSKLQDDKVDTFNKALEVISRSIHPNFYDVRTFANDKKRFIEAIATVLAIDDNHLYAKLYEMLFTQRVNTATLDRYFLGLKNTHLTPAQKLFIAKEFLRFYKDSYYRYLLSFIDDSDLKKEKNELLKAINNEQKKWTDGVFDANIKRDIFVSYKHEDYEVSLKIIAALEADGHKCWHYKRNLENYAGEAFWTSIEAAIENSSIFLYVISEKSQDSNSDCRREYSFASTRNKPRLGYHIDTSRITNPVKHFFNENSGSSILEAAINPTSSDNLDALTSAAFNMMLALENTSTPFNLSPPTPNSPPLAPQHHHNYQPWYLRRGPISPAEAQSATNTGFSISIVFLVLAMLLATFSAISFEWEAALFTILPPMLVCLIIGAAILPPMISRQLKLGDSSKLSKRRRVFGILNLLFTLGLAILITGTVFLSIDFTFADYLSMYMAGYMLVFACIIGYFVLKISAEQDAKEGSIATGKSRIIAISITASLSFIGLLLASVAMIIGYNIVLAILGFTLFSIAALALVIAIYLLYVKKGEGKSVGLVGTAIVFFLLIFAFVMPIHINTPGSNFVHGRLESGARTTITALSNRGLGRTEIAIGNDITTVWGSAFNDATSLTSLTIGSRVDSLNSVRGGFWRNPFEGATNLTTVAVAEGNTTFSSIDSVLYNIDATTLIAIPGGRESLIVPSSVNSFAENAFRSATGLTSVSFEDNGAIGRLPANVFRGAENLVRLTIPFSISSFDSGAFNHTRLDLEIVWHANPNFSGAANIFPERLVEVVLHEQTTNLSMDAFTGTTRVESIIIPYSVTHIARRAFGGWTSEQTIYIQGRSEPHENWDTNWLEHSDARVVWGEAV